MTSPSDNGGQPAPSGAPSVDPIVIDPHDGASAADVASYYAVTADELAKVSGELGVRPSSISVLRMFETRGGEVAIPEGDKASVDALGEHYALGQDTSTPILYQRTGDATVAGTSMFLRVFCYLLDEDTLPPVPAAAATPAPEPVDVAIAGPTATTGGGSPVPTPATEVDVLPAQPVPAPAVPVGPPPAEAIPSA